MYVLAARPSVGKSSLAQAIALYSASNQCPVLMLSQEMPDTEVAERAMSNLGAVDYEAIQTGALKDPEWNGLIEAVEASEHMPFYVDDQGSLTLADIRAKARQVKGLKLLVLDYLQLSAGDGDNRNAEIEHISRGLKSLAKEMGFAVLALSQLNRKVEERASKEPLLSDLRDSGAIEQDADVVMFLWPAVEYPGGSKLVGIKLEKNRQGKKGRFGLDFDGAHQRWVESSDELPTKTAAKAGFE
jgi:replicative DNA helicase